MVRKSSVALCILATVSPLSAQTAAQLSQQIRQQYVSVNAPVLVLTNVRVVDGTGAAAQENQTLVIENGRIRAMGPAATVQAPAGAQTMNLSGKTVIPGMYGMHDHTFYPAGGRGQQRNHHLHSAPRMYLAAGVRACGKVPCPDRASMPRERTWTRIAAG
jgi:enamidase